MKLFNFSTKKKYYYITFTPYNRYQSLGFKTRYDNYDKHRTFWFLGMQLHIGWAYNIDWNTVDIGGVDSRDYPKFCDAYIEYAEFADGTPLDDNELDAATEMNYSRINELAFESLL